MRGRLLLAARTAVEDFFRLRHELLQLHVGRGLRGVGLRARAGTGQRLASRAPGLSDFLGRPRGRGPRLLRCAERGLDGGGQVHDRGRERAAHSRLLERPGSHVAGAPQAYAAPGALGRGPRAAHGHERAAFHLEHVSIKLDGGRDLGAGGLGAGPQQSSAHQHLRRVVAAERRQLGNGEIQRRRAARARRNHLRQQGRIARGEPLLELTGHPLAQGRRRARPALILEGQHGDRPHGSRGAARLRAGGGRAQERRAQQGDPVSRHHDPLIPGAGCGRGGRGAGDPPFPAARPPAAAASVVRPVCRR